MKSVTYTPTEKLKVLWASICVGCEHTSYLNDKFGGHEKALAKALLSKERFPDQSQINRLLTATTAVQVEQWRQSHLQLMSKCSRGKKKKNWLELTRRRKVLAVDLDQRGIAVSGKQFELAAKGYFSRKRTRRGYQLSAMFLGGKVGEVLDEYFDSGETAAIVRFHDLLRTLSWYAKQMNIRAEDILIRGDAQYGTVAVILLIEQFGYRYLFRGFSSAKAENLCKAAEDTWWQVKSGAEAEQLWLSELGEYEHKNQSERGKGEKIRCRTVAEVRVGQSKRKASGHRTKKAEPEPEPERPVSYSYFLTNLPTEELPTERVLEVYDERATIERYFGDEQGALGARYVRTKRFAGAALFQYMVATTNNLLKWAKSSLFGGTRLEKLGLKRFIRQVIEIPARLFKEGRHWTVQLPKEHQQVNWMIESFSGLVEKGGIALASGDG
jgi:hypothetical protein